MTRLRVPSGALAVLATLLTLGAGSGGSACSAGDEGAIDRAQRIAGRAADKTTALLLAPSAQDGFAADERGFASIGLRHARGGTFSDIAASFPRHANETITLGPGNVSSFRMTLRQLGAAHVEGELHEGRVLYPAVFDGVDEIIGGSTSTTEVFYLLESEKAQHTFSWRIDLPKGIARVEPRTDGIWFLDAARAFVLRVPSAYAIDANGANVAATLHWDASESTLSVSLDKNASYKYPVLLDPAFETKVWTELKAPNDLQLPSLTYDAARRNTILTSLDQTWTWDGAAWSARVVARGGVGPSNRYGARIVYDEKRENSLYFGGTWGPRMLADTWLWNGTDWSQARPSTTPSGRYLYGVAYDRGRNEVVLFGGANSSGPLQDTWIWDGASWTQRTPANKPAGRYDAGMAYDATRKKTVLFGGYTSQGTTNETWEWNGVDWQKIAAPTLPDPRGSVSMAYDESRQVMVLFGGATDAGISPDTWTYNGATWKRLTLALSPPPVYAAAMAYESNTKRVLLYGGQDSERASNGIWAWDGAAWRLLRSGDTPKVAEDSTPLYANEARQELQLFSASGSDVNDPSSEPAWGFSGQAWSKRPFRSTPAARRRAAMAWDPVRQETILFGGAGDDALRSDTWTYSTTGWASATPSASPSPRAQHRLAFHPATQSLVLFGGSDDNGLLNDTWTWNGSTWTKLAPSTSPPPRVNFGMALHPASGNLVLYGGIDDQGFRSDTWTWNGSTWKEEKPGKIPEGNNGVILLPDASDLYLVQRGGLYWKWDGSAKDWARLPDIKTLEWDPGKWTPEGAWDPIARRFVVLGTSATFAEAVGGDFKEIGNGVKYTGGVLAWNGQSLVRMSNEQGDLFRAEKTYELPPGKDEWVALDKGDLYPQETFAATYDSTHGAGLILGRDKSDVAHTWLWDGAAMRLRVGDMPFSIRRGAALAFDSSRQQAVLFGGNDNGNPETSDTFLWSGTDWRTASPAHAPPPRNNAASAFDVARGNVVLFGGESSVGYWGDTWVWNGVDWLEKRPQTVPPTRSRFGMTFNPLTGTVLLFGGVNEGGALSDTWSWDGTNWSQIVTKVSPQQRGNHGFAHLTNARRSFVYGGSTFTSTPARYPWAFFTRGGACTSAADCGTSSCVDGVCCEVPSCGTCETCAGTDPGVCTTVINAEDPDSCALANHVSCNEKGLCGPSLGGACKEGSDCGSGICAGGVCCDATCDNPCESCRAAEKSTGRDDGRCGTAKAGTNPGSKCAGQATCSESGVCSQSAGTSCRDARYLDTVSGGTKDCAPYKCIGQCLSRCSSANDCIFPATCGPDGTCNTPPSAPTDDGGCALHTPGTSNGAGFGSFGALALLLLRRHARKGERYARA